MLKKLYRVAFYHNQIDKDTIITLAGDIFWRDPEGDYYIEEQDVVGLSDFLDVTITKDDQRPDAEKYVILNLSGNAPKQ